MPLKEADLTSLQACKRALSKDAQVMTTVGAVKFWIYQKVGVGTGADKETFALFRCCSITEGLGTLWPKMAAQCCVTGPLA